MRDRAHGTHVARQAGTWHGTAHGHGTAHCTRHCTRTRTQLGGTEAMVLGDPPVVQPEMYPEGGRYIGVTGPNGLTLPLGAWLKWASLR